MAKREKAQEKKETYRREQALLTSRRDAEKADELARIARLIGPVKTETDVKVEIEGVCDSDRTPKDIRVKVEEVEDEDAACSLHAPKQEPYLAEDRSTPARDDGPDNWRSVLEPNSDSSDEMSDDDGSEGIGNSDQSGFLPADFRDTDDLLDLDTKPGVGESLFPSGPSTDTMGPPSSTVPIAEQMAGKESEDDLKWTSVGQLVAFRESSVAIADDYLKSQGIKLAKGRTSKFIIQNEAGRQLYRKGRKDAKRINVRRKLLKDAGDD